MPTILECALLAKESYAIAGKSDLRKGVASVGFQQQAAHHGWTLVNMIDNPHPHRPLGNYETGALVMQVWERNGEYIVATRGTDPTNVHDLLSDLQIGLHSHLRVPLTRFAPKSSIQLAPKYHTRGARAYEALAAWDKDINAPIGSITFTGHSLGGNLAQLLAMKYESKDCQFVTFNSPGCHERRADYFGINVCVENDVVRRTGGKNLGVKYLLKNTDKFSCGAAHSMDNLIKLLRQDEIQYMDVQRAINHAKTHRRADPKDNWRLPRFLHKRIADA